MTTSFGPVSQELAQQLQEQVQQHKLIIWLVSANHYSAFADQLMQQRADGRLNYDVKAFRGSYLELLLELQDLTGGVSKKPLVIHLPGFNTTNVTTTPMLELYLAGTEFEKKMLTLITDAAATKLPADQIVSFLSKDELSLKDADDWLLSSLADDGSGLTGHLRSLNLTILIHDLLTPEGFVPSQLKAAASAAERQQIASEVTQRLASLTGAPSNWLITHVDLSQIRPADIASNAVIWALCVEYVDDLTRPPIQEDLKAVQTLPDAVRNECCRLARDLRQNRPDFYRSTALDTQDRLDIERREAVAEDLGRIDTFPFEEEKILRAAIAAIAEQKWDRAIQWAEHRTEDQSFWQRGDASRGDAWKLVSAAAELGLAIHRAGPTLGVVSSLDAALERYTQVGSRVDLAHRRMEQIKTKRLLPGVQEFELLKEMIGALRHQWRAWADRWACDFNAVCQQHGFLPRRELQQRRLFDDVVRSSVQSAVTALFLIDGMRYEMALELYEELAGTPTTLKLDARFAELPTVTEVGMNVLAAVSSGNRLQLALNGDRIQGFSTGSFRVNDPKSRQRAMKDRVGGSKCPWFTLQEVLERPKASLQNAIRGARLLVVESKEIDRSGHAGSGLSQFSQTLQEIKAAWRLLRDAGVKSFVITSDHGFLFFPQVEQATQTYGRVIDPNGRHVISLGPSGHPNEVSVPLRSLDYDCEDLHVIFPASTVPFDCGSKVQHFVHGGNSFQERVIPVMTILHAAPRGSKPEKYHVRAVADEPVLGMHRLKAALLLDKAVLGLEFGEPVELGLQVLDGEDVRVEIQEVSGGGRLEANTIVATVGQEFEVFFRLTGTVDQRVRVQLAHTTGIADVTPGVVSERYQVSIVQNAHAAKPAATTVKPDDSGKGKESSVEKPKWLMELPSDEIRAVFAHLEMHGVITESEVATKLGGPRAVRRFSSQFDTLAKQAPFAIRIESVNGVKRYIKEGGAS